MAAGRPARAQHFDRILWSLLEDAPPLHELMRTWLQHLVGREHKVLPTTLDEQFQLLIEGLRQRPCLLVLDDFAAVMASAVPGGESPTEAAQAYRPGCEGYSRLLQQVARLRHQNCLVVVSRAEPYIIQQLVAEGERLCAAAG